MPVAPSPPSPGAVPDERRTALAALAGASLVLGGTLMLLAGLIGCLASARNPGPLGESVLAVAVPILALGIVYFGTGRGVLRSRPWARSIGIIVGLLGGLLFGILTINLSRSEPNWIGIVIVALHLATATVLTIRWANPVTPSAAVIEDGVREGSAESR